MSFIIFLKSIFEISSGYLKESFDEIKKQTLKGYLCDGILRKSKIYKKMFLVSELWTQKAVQKTNIQNFQLNQERGIFVTKTQKYSPVLL